MRELGVLFEKNANWSKEISQRAPEFFRRLSKQQSPEYLWIGCSDSRVPANQIVGLDPGATRAYYYAALIYFERERYDSALVLINQCLERHPGFPGANELHQSILEEIDKKDR